MTKAAAGNTTSDDDHAVRGIVARGEAAWNAGNGTAFADEMREAADFVAVFASITVAGK